MIDSPWPDGYYEQDGVEGPNAWIQWKGTNVCMDVRCSCGELSHFDGDFAYFMQCPHCHANYAVGQTVRLYPLSAQNVRDLDNDPRFKVASP